MINWDDVDSAERYQLHCWVESIGIYVQDTIVRIKIGVYDEDREGDLLKVLEEIEGMIRNG